MASEGARPANRVRDAETCRAWLDTLASAPRERIAAIMVLLERLRREDIAPDPCFECLELVRVDLLGAIDDAARPLHVASIPFAIEQRVLLEQLHAALRGLRDGYKRAYARMADAASLDTRSVIPGATNALRVALPLARALDAQARGIALLLRCRTLVAEPEWDELCLVAQHMRRTTFLDETLHDNAALSRPNTARAAFIYPLLLLLAGCESFADAERTLVDKLARRWAPRVGFTFELRDARASAQDGPVLAPGTGPRLRLDTGKVLKSLAGRRDEWLSGERSAGRAALGLGAAGLTALLDHLAKVWGQGGRIDPGVAAPGALVRVRFGLPGFWMAAAEANRDEPLRWLGEESPAYRSNSRESESVLRMALGTVAAARNGVAALMAEAQTEHLYRAAQREIVFDRQSATPTVTLGDLVALLHFERDAAAGGDARPAETARLMLGRVAWVQQFSGVVPPGMPTHRVGVRLLAGTPVPVGVRTADEQSFSDAFLLRAAGEQGTSLLVMLPGVVPSGTRITVREGTVDARVRADARLGAGPGYQMLAVSGET